VTTTERLPTAELPRWSVGDVHDSLDARSFIDALERAGADTDVVRRRIDDDTTLVGRQAA
jgi:hypothetical protein